MSAGLGTPDKVLDVGWDELVRLLDEAHYVRHDFSTADIDINAALISKGDNLVLTG